MTTRASRSRGMPRRTAPVATTPSRLPLVLGGAVIALIVVAAVVAFALGGATSSGLAEPARAATGVTGTALPTFSDPTSDPAIGQAIPTLTGTDLAGNVISIGPGDGPMAVVLLAHWCSHCQAEVPVLVDYLGSTGMPDGVRLVALSTSIDPARPNYPPSAWLEREGWTAPTMVDDASSSALTALGMASFPGFVFVDADGTVVQRYTGEMPVDAFDQVVRSLAP
ncbi:MAG TPA: TlpA disulfide reductase family protein [Candidatus Limnocylindria bacterium]